MGSAGNANAPSSAVMYVLLKPVSLFRTVTLDCGTVAPVVSTTMPLKLAVVNCARQGETSRARSRNTIPNAKEVFLMTPPRVGSSSISTEQNYATFLAMDLLVFSGNRQFCRNNVDRFSEQTPLVVQTTARL